MPTKTAPPKTVDQRAESVTMIPTDRVHPAPDNPRQDLGDLSELVESIRAQGILQPLVVTPDTLPDHYMVVIGHRRLAAAVGCQSTWVPCIVRPYDQRGRQEAMLVENLQRVDLTALEEARAFKRLVELGLSQRDVAERVGRSQAHVSKRMALLELPGKVLGSVGSGKLSIGDALELTKLADDPKRLEKAFAEGQGYYGGVEGAVRHHLQEKQEEEAFAAAQTKLQSAGVKILKAAQSGYYSWYNRPEKPLKGQNSDHDSIGLTEAEHKAEPCHAAAIQRDGKIIYVCTEPARHADKDPKAKDAASRTDGVRADREKELKKARQIKLETAARLAVARQIVQGPLDQQIVFMAREISAIGTVDETRFACEVLGLEAEKQKYGYPDFRKKLEQHAASSKKAALQVLMAIAMSGPESTLSSKWSSGGSESNKAYRDLLAAAGYVKPKLDVQGKARVARPAPKQPTRTAIPTESVATSVQRGEIDGVTTTVTRFEPTKSQYPKGTCIFCGSDEITISLDAGPACSEHEGALQRVAAVPA